MQQCLLLPADTVRRGFLRFSLLEALGRQGVLRDSRLIPDRRTALRMEQQKVYGYGRSPGKTTERKSAIPHRNTTAVGGQYDSVPDSSLTHAITVKFGNHKR